MKEVLQKLSSIHDDVIRLKAGQDTTNNHLKRLNGSILAHQEHLDDLDEASIISCNDLKWFKRIFWTGLTSVMTIATSVFIFVILN